MQFLILSNYKQNLYFTRILSNCWLCGKAFSGSLGEFSTITEHDFAIAKNLSIFTTEEDIFFNKKVNHLKYLSFEIRSIV